MDTRYLMAVDAGTGSVRAVLFTVDGVQAGCVQAEWSHPADPRFPGSMDFTWEENWTLASGCIRRVLEETGVDPAAVAAVSTTSMREGLVLYDRRGREIWACANVDARSGQQAAQLRALDPLLESQCYAHSGQTFALSALPRLLWVRDNLPEVYARTARIGMFNDWLAYKLTGELAVEPSNGCTTGLFDLRSRSWFPRIAQQCGLREDLFPPVAECGSVLAPVSPQGAADTGLAPGTPVVVGGGDSQLGSIGAGVVSPDQAAVLGGSFWQYEYTVDDPKADPLCRMRVNCHAVPGLWQYEVLAFQPGLTMRWYRDAFCQQEVEEAKATGQDPFDLLDAKASAVPAGSCGMQCCFSNTMNFINWRHASPTFTNFLPDAQRFNRYTFYRALQENTAFILRSHIELLRESIGKDPGELIFAGGAAKSVLWSQIIADVTGKVVKVPAVKEATALGAALLAGVGVGIYADLRQAAERAVRWDRTFIPNPANRELYDQLYHTWQRIYSATLTLSNVGLTRPLWQPPGMEPPIPENFLLNESQREYRFGDTGPKYLMEGPRMSFAVARFEPGQTFQPHSHNLREENFYIIEGKIDFFVDGVRHTLSPGDFLHVEPRTVHCLRNPYDRPVKFISTMTPFRAGDKTLFDDPDTL